MLGALLSLLSWNLMCYRLLVSGAVYVPDVPPCPMDLIEQVAAELAGKKVSVLTGAGCSTESGIPDYRGARAQDRPRRPMEFKTFMQSVEARQRYWARSVVGWRRFSNSRPCEAHSSLAQLQAAGHVLAPITQNVDRLHHKAGSRDVIELHGALAEAQCMSCGRVIDRDQLQSELLALNPSFATRTAAVAPDGDSDLDDGLVSSFVVADCDICGGFYKPHVVFFGESVPRLRVEMSLWRVESSDAILFLGTSLAVFSGFRFAKKAAAKGIPIYVINVGDTRADEIAYRKIEARVGDFLSGWARLLT